VRIDKTSPAGDIGGMKKRYSLSGTLPDSDIEEAGRVAAGRNIKIDY